MKIAILSGAVAIAMTVLSSSAIAQQPPQSAASDEAPTWASGATGYPLVCASPTGTIATPGKRYIDCHDGTVVDTSTGLMWELKDTACAMGDLHCANNTYTWSSSGTHRDGSLYTVFLAGLNADTVTSSATYPNGTSSGSGCFANHCDWRIPNIAELQTIHDTTSTTPPACEFYHKAEFGSLCIDAAFDPSGYGTQSAFYWSSSSYATSPDSAWGIYFNNGFDLAQPKRGSENYARAVRGGG